ncbi:MAG TPA: Fic family protein [Chitinophagaceae bacterium]|nr:Fic family protein [Chitinophagaceae bacterium]
MEQAYYILQINSLKKELESLLPMSNEQQEKLDKKIRLEFHYNSNHIEGNTLTYAETELLLIFDDTRGNHTFREYEEMKASEVAYKMIEAEAQNKEQPLTESFIKNLNKILLVEPYWKEAITQSGQTTRRKILVGDYKKQPNSVRLSNGEIFHYASPQETPILMGELMQWYKERMAQRDMHPVQVAAQLHYKFVRIHPFDDGNGRISRLLMNYVLLYNNYPPVIIKSADKANYLGALHDADVGNIESFEQYVAKQLISTFNLSIAAAKGENIEEDEDWKKELAVLKKDLSAKGDVSQEKSEKAVMNVLNNEISPLIKDIQNSIKEYDDLFFKKKITRKQQDKDGAISDLFLPTSAAGNHSPNIQFVFIDFIYKDFKKNGANHFNVSVSLSIEFTRTMYVLKGDNTLSIAKYYHEGFSKKDVSKIANFVGNTILQNIKRHLASK